MKINYWLIIYRVLLHTDTSYLTKNEHWQKSKPNKDGHFTLENDKSGRILHLKLDGKFTSGVKIIGPPPNKTPESK